MTNASNDIHFASQVFASVAHKLNEGEPTTGSLKLPFWLEATGATRIESKPSLIEHPHTAERTPAVTPTVHGDET